MSRTLIRRIAPLFTVFAFIAGWFGSIHTANAATQTTHQVSTIEARGYSVVDGWNAVLIETTKDNGAVINTVNTNIYISYNSVWNTAQPHAAYVNISRWPSYKPWDYHPGTIKYLDRNGKLLKEFDFWYR